VTEAAPLLSRDDDVGFMNKVALILKPPVLKPKPPKKEDE
jgi:hypothetical protein